MDEYLMKLSEEGKVYWINEYFDQKFRKTIRRVKTQAVWAFALKAKYAIYRDGITNEPTKYGNCEWFRCKCTLCDYRCTCESATTLKKHLQRDHKFDAPSLSEEHQKLFCEATGFSMEQLIGDPETIEAQAEMQCLIEKYRIDTEEYNYTMTPQSLKNQPEEIQRKLHRGLIKMLVGVHATPSSANKRVVSEFIDVCIYKYFFFLLKK